MPQVKLELKEIYQNMCPKCQEKIRDLVKEKLADQAVKKALEGK